jgi:hypothetical protein
MIHRPTLYIKLTSSARVSAEVLIQKKRGTVREVLTSCWQGGVGQSANADRMSAQANCLAASLVGNVSVISAPLLTWASCPSLAFVRNILKVNSWLKTLRDTS